MARVSKKPSAALPAPGAEYQPAEVLLINTAEQLRVISDPLRMEILECVSSEALTVKQIAARLAQPATKLYYHVSALEAAGFVVMVDTRIKSGIVEKYYRIAAQNIQIDRSLLKQSDVEDDALQTILSAVFDSTIADLQQSFAAGLLGLEQENRDFDQRLILTRSTYQLRASDVPKFVEKFRNLLKELDAEEDQTDPVSYACTIAFYPRVQTKSRKNPTRRVS